MTDTVTAIKTKPEPYPDAYGLTEVQVREQKLRHAFNNHPWTLSREEVGWLESQSIPWGVRLPPPEGQQVGDDVEGVEHDVLGSIVTLSDYTDHKDMSTQSDIDTQKKSPEGLLVLLHTEDALLMRVARIRRMLPHLDEMGVDAVESTLRRCGYASLWRA